MIEKWSRSWQGLALCLAALVASWVLTVTVIGPRAVIAQEDKDLEAADKAAAEKKAEVKEDKAAGKAPEPEQSLLEFYFESLGWRYTIAFLAISLTFVALIVMNVLALKRDSIVPMGLVETFEGHLNEKRYQEAYDLAKNDESFLGQVLSAGLAKLSTGYPQAIEAMQEVGEEETMKLEHRLSYIALIGTVSPMVGLLGTVDGMVQAFRVIAASDVQPKPSELAQGISKALITTLVGLIMAIPAVAFFGIMRNRLGRLTLEVGILSEGLMGRFSPPTKKA